MTTNIQYVTAEKSEDLLFAVAEAWNLTKRIKSAKDNF